VAIFYLDYLNHLLSNGPASCRRDRKLIVECFALNLKTSNIDQYTVFEEHLGTGVFKPKRGSFDTKFLNEDFFLLLLRSPKKYSLDYEGLLKATNEHGFWKAHLVILLELGKISAAIELALQLDDVDALEKATQGNTTIKLWEFVISHFSELRAQRFSLAPVPNPITEEKCSLASFFLEIFFFFQADHENFSTLTVINLMITDVGPQKAIDLLLRHPQLYDTLRPDFFEKFVVEAVKNQQKQEIVHSMLEIVDGYLWVRKANSMAPPVRHIKDLELGEETAKKLGASPSPSGQKLRTLPYLQPVTGSGVPARFAFDLSTAAPYPRYLEEPDIQWGVCCDIGGGACSVCTLPLVEGVSASLANVVLLECGHGFHQMCLVEDACVVCFAKDKNSLFVWEFDSLV